jgi:2-methylcitrate dehydratase PrpD
LSPEESFESDEGVFRFQSRGPKESVESGQVSLRSLSIPVESEEESIESIGSGILDFLGLAVWLFHRRRAVVARRVTSKFSMWN